MNYKIFPPDELDYTEIRLPLSKSISNRVLIINALCGNKGNIDAVADCDDTSVMTEALSHTTEEVNIGAAGTAMRFLTAYFAIQPGRTVTVTGTDRMKQRPIKVLVDALRECGAEIEYVENEGFPPLRITGKELSGGSISLPADISSQYISALLMIAPAMKQGLTLTLEGDIVSKPYILMTLGLMKQWGIDYTFTGNVISIAPQSYTPIEFTVEADWSAASYWFELAALTASELGLKGLHDKSLQGDSKIMEYFTAFGVNSAWNDAKLDLEPSPDIAPRIKLDLSEQPDIAQTLVVTACLLNIPFQFSGLSTLKIKETDRLTALCNELRKLSFNISVIDDKALEWEGARWSVDFSQAPAIDTYKDHRMAMAFAPLAYFFPGIIINDAGVVTKSYPSFWDDMKKAGFTIDECE